MFTARSHNCNTCATPQRAAQEHTPHARGRMMADSQTSESTVALEHHEPPFTKSGGFVAPKFGSAGSGGAEYEPLPEAHDDPTKP
jgi:hypothetical protein